MKVVRPIREYIHALVHPSARHDALTAARHRAFIAPRLLVSSAVLAAFPLYVAFRGAPGAFEVLIVASFVAPMLIAFFVSHTGRYEAAHLLSAFTWTGLGAGFAAATGGIASFAMVWLVIVPLEAALSASARIIATASVLSVGAIVLMLTPGTQDLLAAPPADQPLAVLCVAGAAVYSIAIGAGAQHLLRISMRLRNAEAERNRLFSGIMTDAITRHDNRGEILFASPAAEPLFGLAARDLIGNGLFDRVHVADRPAYLTALGDAAAFGHERLVEFRMRRDFSEPSRRNQFVWIEMRCRPLDNPPAEPRDREVIAVMRDITQRKQQEQTIETLRVDLVEAAAAHSKFLAVIGREQRDATALRSGNPDLKVKRRA